MKPVAVYRHAPTEGPGYLATFLEEHRVPWRLVRLDEGDGVAASASDFAGIALMGGPMSVNDEHAWLGPVLALIRDAVRREVPVIGHCLGGQLLAKALGGSVTKNPVKEIGWHRVEVEDSPQARDWFGPGVREFAAFQWHEETFAIPPEGSRILRGEHCLNQAFVVGDRHVGMQCHLEMTPELVRTWCETGEHEISRSLHSPAVQPAGEILGEMASRMPALTQRACHLYRRWVRGLA